MPRQRSVEVQKRRKGGIDSLYWVGSPAIWIHFHPYHSLKDQKNDIPADPNVLHEDLHIRCIPSPVRLLRSCDFYRRHRLSQGGGNQVPIRRWYCSCISHDLGVEGDGSIQSRGVIWEKCIYLVLIHLSWEYLKRENGIPPIRYFYMPPRRKSSYSRSLHSWANGRRNPWQTQCENNGYWSTCYVS